MFTTKKRNCLYFNHLFVNWYAEFFNHGSWIFPYVSIFIIFICWFTINFFKQWFVSSYFNYPNIGEHLKGKVIILQYKWQLWIVTILQCKWQLWKVIIVQCKLQLGKVIILQCKCQLWKVIILKNNWQ